MGSATPLNQSELRAALAQSRFQAHYQPIVSIKDRRPVGMEVLARLDHPTLGSLPPDAFVTLLENSGLAWPLTRAIIDRAFDEWSAHAMARFGLFLAINFPLDVMLMPEALDYLAARRGIAGIPPARLVIELTESRPIERVEELGRAVGRLRAEGCGVAIDDVGPDVRDPSLLFSMQFTSLKLDKDIVREPPSSAAAAKFLASTIAAAHAAGLVVTAEGVEDVSVWERMRAFGADQAQGYLVARPLPPEAIEEWLKEWR